MNDQANDPARQNSVSSTAKTNIFFFLTSFSFDIITKIFARSVQDFPAYLDTFVATTLESRHPNCPANGQLGLPFLSLPQNLLRFTTGH